MIDTKKMNQVYEHWLNGVYSLNDPRTRKETEEAIRSLVYKQCPPRGELMEALSLFIEDAPDVIWVACTSFLLGRMIGTAQTRRKEVLPRTDPIAAVEGRSYPVKGIAAQNGSTPVPVVDIPWMSDIKWQRDGLVDRLKRPDVYKQVDADVNKAIEHLRTWILENDPDGAEWLASLEEGSLPA